MRERHRLDLGGTILRAYDRRALRRVLWLLRREKSRPHEPNPAAAQWSGLTTLRRVYAEYRRRGWSIPKAVPLGRYLNGVLAIVVHGHEQILRGPPMTEVVVDGTVVGGFGAWTPELDAAVMPREKPQLRLVTPE